MINPVDLIIMDICTAGRVSGLRIAAKIHKSLPHIKSIVVTSQPEVGFVQRAYESEIDSFWYKMTEETELISVMRRTMSGERVYPIYRPVIRLGMIRADELTSQEVYVLRELTSGDPTKVLAERLHLSARTVDNTISRILEKTGFSTRTKLACAAVESGIVIRDM